MMAVAPTALENTHIYVWNQSQIEFQLQNTLLAYLRVGKDFKTE
jgi:hypothetical protein